MSDTKKSTTEGAEAQAVKAANLLDSLPLDELVRAGLRRFWTLSPEMKKASAALYALEGLEAWVCRFDPEKAYNSFREAAHCISEEMSRGN